jgi:hypothetical protein
MVRTVALRAPVAVAVVPMVLEVRVVAVRAEVSIVVVAMAVVVMEEAGAAAVRAAAVRVVADMFTVQPGPTTGPSAPHRLTPPTLGSNMYPVGHRAPQPWCRLECVDMPLPRLSAHISPLARLAVITPLHERPVSRGLGHVSSSTCIM